MRPFVLALASLVVANLVGARIGYRLGGFSVDLTAKTALGATHEVVSALGTTTIGGPGAALPGNFPGGAVFVQPSNLGRQSQDTFAVVPQVEVKVGYDVLPRVRATVGYDYLYWSDVVRPGSQIDSTLNPTQSGGGTLVGPARPAPQFNHTDFFTHGVSFGLEIQF